MSFDAFEPPTAPRPRDALPAGGRVPPHSLDAERAVLGGIMLENNALNLVTQILSPDDFYSRANGLVFEAMSELFRRGQPVDLVTLRAWLVDHGHLQKAGGDEHLLSLTETIPTVENIEHHAEIVRDKAVVRRLIQRCHEIAAQGYGEYGDVKEYVDDAEKKIFEVAKQSAKAPYEHIKDVVIRTFEQVTEAAERKERITGMPTGFGKLDRMTAGLKGGELIIVAGRPGMGKTAFALNVALHACAERRVPVAVFSLEMAKEELARRLLCSEARVDGGRMRTGMLSREDWTRLTSAAGSLTNLQLYIDDTPALSIMELRGKARRLKAEHGLGLVVVDYLQLMRAGNKVESREKEISEISRSLKALAKELEMPVMALSQLNRGVETRSGKDKRPQLADLRECVPGDTRVILADGRRVPIEQLVGTTPDVLAVEDGRVVSAQSDAVWCVGERDVLDVVLASGRRIRATARHRVLGWDGWRRVGELAAGDRIATARSLPEPDETIEWHDDLVALLGQLIGDGSYLRGQPMRYTSASEENLEIVARAASEQLGASVKRYAGRGRRSQLLLSGNGTRWKPEGVNRWLRELGIFGQRSRDKRVPDEAFRLGTRQIAILLRHLWATDGTIYVAPKDKRTGNKVAFATCSRGLAEDVMALLLRVGVPSRVYATAQGRHDAVHHVVVSGAEHQRRFLAEVGAFGPRVAPAARLSEVLATLAGNTNADTVPRAAFDRVRELMGARGITQRAMASLRGTSYGGTAHFTFDPSRGLLAEYAELLDDESLRNAASSDLFWDRVVEVRPAGREKVYDLTVPGPASWLADGIVSHNSGAIEQDADVILFIYREEFYNREDPELRGIAEIIIGKQRAGPVGTVKCRFFHEYTRFENLSDDDYGGGDEYGGGGGEYGGGGGGDYGGADDFSDT